MLERLAAEAKTLPCSAQSYLHENAAHLLDWDNHNRAEQEWQQRLANMNPLWRFFMSGRCRRAVASTIPFLIFGAALYGIASVIFTFLPEKLLPTAWVCWTIALVGLILAQRIDRLSDNIERLGRRP
jgi:hypothetical protein